MRNDHHSSQISLGFMELEQCKEPLAIFGIQEVLQKWQLWWNCYGSVIIDRITRILLLSMSCSFHIADSNWNVMNFILVAIWSKQASIFYTSATIDRSWVITIVRLKSFLCGCVGRYCPVLVCIHNSQKSLVSPVIIFSLFNGCGRSLAVHIWVESQQGINSCIGDLGKLNHSKCPCRLTLVMNMWLLIPLVKYIALTLQSWKPPSAQWSHVTPTLAAHIMMQSSLPHYVLWPLTPEHCLLFNHAWFQSG